MQKVSVNVKEAGIISGIKNGVKAVYKKGIKPVVKGGWDVVSGNNVENAVKTREVVLNGYNKKFLSDTAKYTPQQLQNRLDVRDTVKAFQDKKVGRAKAINNLANLSLGGAAGYGMYKGISGQASGPVEQQYQQDAAYGKTASIPQMNYSSEPSLNPNQTSYTNTQDYYDYQELAGAETNNMPDRTNLPVYGEVIKSAAIVGADKDAIAYALDLASGVVSKTANMTNGANKVLGAALFTHAAHETSKRFSDPDNNPFGNTPPGSSITPYYR